jgi:hypothetical protein
MSTRTRVPGSSGLGRRSTRPFVVAVLCAAFVAAAPATAQAQTASDADTVGDMITFNDDDAVVLAPERTLNDVSSTTLAHRARRVAIEVNYVDLKKRTGGFQSLHILMKTNEGARRVVALVAEPQLWSGATMMFRGNGASMRCAVRHVIDYEANVMRVGFPRRCASNPRWVRFRIGASARGDDGYFADDALSDSPIDSQDSNDLARSDRVYRGAVS